MKFQVTDRVSIFQNDAILGLSDDQARHRAHQLEALGQGRYRVSGPNVKFWRGEVVDIIETPAPSIMKEDAAKLGVKFGLGIGGGELAERIAVAKAESAEYDRAAVARINARIADTKKARAKAAKARK